MFQAKSRRMDSKEFEDTYQKLVEQPWEHDESFPLAYKIEIIHDLLLLFNDFKHYSRWRKILNIFEELSEKYSEDSNIGLLYIDWLLRQSIKITVFSYPDINDLIDKVNNIENRFKLSNETLDENEYK